MEEEAPIGGGKEREGNRVQESLDRVVFGYSLEINQFQKMSFFFSNIKKRIVLKNGLQENIHNK